MYCNVGGILITSLLTVYELNYTFERKVNYSSYNKKKLFIKLYQMLMTWVEFNN